MSVEFERGKVYTIDRGGPQIGTGQGMLKGLAIVWSHFLDSLTKKLTKPDEISGVFTVPYPEERLDYPETFRSFPILLYDDATGQDLCTSCFQCERICPPQVIHITQAKDPVTGKAVPAAQAFDLEYDACMSCSLCAEVCPFDAIKMDQDFELSTDLRAGLTIHKEGLVRPVSYYEKLAPTLWAEVSAGAMKKLQGAIKRRPAGIGQSSEPTGAAKVETAPTGAGLPPEAGGRPRAPEPVVATRPAQAAPAPRPAAPISATPAAQPAASAGLPPEAGGAVQDTKAAKLAAIRAANAAKQAGGQGAGTVEIGTSGEPAGDAPLDDKAAKLAAIRAANAAKKAANEPIPAVTPPGDAPLDDKAAKLAAIRAANAAKKAANEPIPAVTPPGDAPLDDKAAKLAAIRAANAAKKAAEDAADQNEPSS